MAYVQKLCTRLGLNSRAVASSPWCSNLANPTKSRTVFTGRFLPIENTKQKTSLGDKITKLFFFVTYAPSFYHLATIFKQSFTISTICSKKILIMVTEDNSLLATIFNNFSSHTQ